jgi:hypothetical protein
MCSRSQALRSKLYSVCLFQPSTHSTALQSVNDKSFASVARALTRPRGLIVTYPGAPGTPTMGPLLTREINLIAPPRLSKRVLNPAVVVLFCQ